MSLESGKIKTSEKLYLEAEWQSQAQKMAKLFAKDLGLTKEQYLAYLPRFEPQPEQYKGRFDIPVIVETRIPLKRVIKEADIYICLDPSSIIDWKKSGFTTGKQPYTAWLNDGRSNLGESVDAVRNSLKFDERGGTVFEGIALYLRNPRIIDDHFLAFPGSQVFSIGVPYLSNWHGRIELAHRLVGSATSNCGSVIAGRK